MEPSAECVSEIALTRQRDTSCRIAGAHFRLGALQRRKEGGKDERGFRVSDSRRHVTRHPEVRILIDGARNQTWDVTATVEDERKGGAVRKDKESEGYRKSR